MKNRILLVILTIITTSCFAQNGKTKTTTKPTSTQENINIIGQWTPIFDRDENGKKASINPTEIDTIIFNKDGKYIKLDKEGAIKGTWNIDEKNKLVNYKNSSFDMMLYGKLENITLGDSFNRYINLTKDTLTFKIYLKETADSKYIIRYYIKK